MPNRAADRNSGRKRSRWASVWLYLVEAPLIVAVAIGFAAVYLHPRPFWWAQLVAILLPYSATGLAMVSLPALLAGRWKLVAVNLFLLGLVAVRAAPESGVGAAEGDLALTTFNVPQADPNRAALGDSVVSFVERAAPDLLLLQDTWVYTDRSSNHPDQAVQATQVVQRLPYRRLIPERVVPRKNWQRGGTGVPLFVRTPSSVVVQEIEEIALGGGPDGSMAIRIGFRWKGRNAVLYNVHLRSFGEAKPWYDPNFGFMKPSTWRPYLRSYREVYAKRGEEVSQLAKRIEMEDEPVIVAGDFNSTVDNWSVRQLRRAGLSGKPARLDGFRSAAGWVVGHTYHATRPLVRIDLVLVDPAFQVTEARVSPVEFSDHRPVRLRLRWRDGGQAGGTKPDSSSGTE